MKTLCILIDKNMLNNQPVNIDDVETFMFIHHFLSRHLQNVFNVDKNYKQIEVKIVCTFHDPKSVYNKTILNITEFNYLKIDDKFQHKIKDGDGDIDLDYLKNALKKHNKFNCDYVNTEIKLDKPRYDYIIYSDNKEFKNLRFKNKNITIVKPEMEEKLYNHPMYKEPAVINQKDMFNNLDLITDNYLLLAEDYFIIMHKLGLLNINNVKKLPNEFKLRDYRVIYSRIKDTSTFDEFSPLWCKLKIFNMFKTKINWIINYDYLHEIYKNLARDCKDDNYSYRVSKPECLSADMHSAIFNIETFARTIVEIVARHTNNHLLKDVIIDYCIKVLQMNRVDNERYYVYENINMLLTLIGLFDCNLGPKLDNQHYLYLCGIVIDLDIIKNLNLLRYSYYGEYLDNETIPLIIRYYATKSKLNKIAFASNDYRNLHIANFTKESHNRYCSDLGVGSIDLDSIHISKVNMDDLY